MDRRTDDNATLVLRGCVRKLVEAGLKCTQESRSDLGFLRRIQIVSKPATRSRQELCVDLSWSLLRGTDILNEWTDLVLSHLVGHLPCHFFKRVDGSISALLRVRSGDGDREASSARLSAAVSLSSRPPTNSSGPSASPMEPDRSGGGAPRPAAPPIFRVPPPASSRARAKTT